MIAAARALIGLVSLPVIVASTCCGCDGGTTRRQTFLWQQLVRDVEANAPWQRLRFSWLLLVQLLIAHAHRARRGAAVQRDDVGPRRERRADRRHQRIDGDPVPTARIGWRWRASEPRTSSAGCRRAGA